MLRGLLAIHFIFSRRPEIATRRIGGFGHRIGTSHQAPNKNTGETFLVIWKQNEDSGTIRFYTTTKQFLVIFVIRTVGP